MYEMLYRDLSSKAAHPTVRALDRHIKDDGAGNLVGFHWGPDMSDVGDVIRDTCTAFFCSAPVVAQTFVQSEIDGELAQCWADHKALLERQV